MMASGEYGKVDAVDDNRNYVEMEVIRDHTALTPNGQVVVDRGTAADASAAVNKDIQQLTQPGQPLGPGGQPTPATQYAPAPLSPRGREPLNQNNPGAHYDGGPLETSEEQALREARDAGVREGRDFEQRANAENARRLADANRVALEAAKQQAEAEAAQKAADKAAADQAKKRRTQKIVGAVIGLTLLASSLVVWALLFGPGRRLIGSLLGLKTKDIDRDASGLEESIEIDVLLENGSPVFVDAVQIFQNAGDTPTSEIDVGVGTWSVSAYNTVVYTPYKPQTQAVTIQYVILGVSGAAAPAQSDPALITIHFAATSVPVAFNIPFTATDRTTDPDIDVPTLSKNPDFQGDVKLVATDGTQSNSLTDTTGGVWSVDVNTQHVKFTLPQAGIAVASVQVNYLLKLGMGTSNIAAIVVSFPSAGPPLVANDIAQSPASTPPTTRNAAIDFDIPAANGNFTGTVSLIDTAGAKTASLPVTDATGATVGIWAVTTANHIAFTPAGTVSDSVLFLTAIYVLTGPGDSNHATLTIGFPPGAAAPAAANIALPACSRDLFTTFPVPAANATLGAISQVQFVGAATPNLVPVNDPSTGQRAGNWVVLPDNTVQFQPVFPCRLDTVTVQYTLQAGAVSATAGTLTAAFTRTPEAFACSGTSTSRADAVKIGFLDYCIVPEGFQSFEFTIGGTDVSIPGTGRWFLDTPSTGNPTANFSAVAEFTGPSTEITFTVTDNKGAVSNQATLTANFIVPMARNFLVAKSVAKKELVATDVLADTPSRLPKDPKSVQLVALRDLGQNQAVPAGYLHKSGRAMQVDGEGVWLVDDNGLIVFQADDNFSGAPTPVVYRYADTSGNYSNTAAIVIDHNLAAIDEFLTAVSKQSDTDFWASFEGETITIPGTDDLDSDEFITVTQTYAAAVARLITGSLHNPVPETAYTAAFNAWVAAGQPNDGLLSACKALVGTATKGVPRPFVNRHWRLTMMVRMLVQGNP